MINAWRVFFEKQVYQEVLAKLMKSDPLMMAAATTTTAESPYVVREGKAEIHFKSKSDAFYNPVQEFNRDMRWVFNRHSVCNQYTLWRTSPRIE